jgi:hypothetical protein
MPCSGPRIDRAESLPSLFTMPAAMRGVRIEEFTDEDKYVVRAELHVNSKTCLGRDLRLCPRGDARFRAVGTDGSPVFVGLARSADVNAYLSGVHHTVTAIGPTNTSYDDHDGTAPSTLPTEQTIWRAKASGPGEPSITWPVENGEWTLVVMAADASPDVNVRADVGATAPALGWVWIVVLISAGVTLVLGLLLVVLAVVRRPQAGPSTL